MLAAMSVEGAQPMELDPSPVFEAIPESNDIHDQDGLQIRGFN